MTSALIVKPVKADKPVKKMFNVRLEPAISYQAKVDAVKNRMTMEEWVTHALKLAHELDLRADREVEELG